MIVKAVEDAEGKVDNTPLVQALNWFKDENVKLEGLFHVGAGVLKQLWRKWTETTAQRVTIRMLERLSKRQGGHAVIDGLLEMVDMIFGIDVINAEKVRNVISGWKGAGGGRIIRP